MEKLISETNYTTLGWDLTGRGKRLEYESSVSRDSEQI